VNSTYSMRRALLDAKSANFAKAKVQAAAVQAEIFARSAAETNKRAQAEIEELLAVPERAAEAVAAEAEEMFLRDAAKWDRLKTEGDAAIAAVMGTPPPARTWAGEQAAKPYAEAAQRAQAARLALEAQSSQLADLAQQLRQSASKVLAQSKAAASAGKEQLAEKLQIRMADYMQEAEDAQAASDNDADAAGKMQGAEEAYAKQAATAAERASVISRLYWLPPAVPGGDLSAAAAAVLAPAPAPAAAASFLARAITRR